MNPLARRLLVVAVIALVGGGAGLALGSFVANGPGRSGAGNDDEMTIDGGTVPAGNPDDQPVLPPAAQLASPEGYSCQGCDAGLHNDMILGNESALAPMPPYHSEDRLLLPEPAPQPASTPPAAPALKLPPETDKTAPEISEPTPQAGF